MRIKLSDHFDYNRILRFTAPSMVMMVFVSIYSIVDGFFISNFAGKIPFAALNLMYPMIGMMAAVGFMFGTGGSAIVAKTLGEKKNELANKYFSMFVYFTFLVGVVIVIIGQIIVPQVAVFFGAKGELLKYSILYCRIVFLGVPFLMLQQAYQTFFSTAEKPKYGLLVILGAGIINIIFDALFVIVFDWGLAGAAAATALSQFVGGVLPTIYFARKNSSLLQLGKTTFIPSVLRKAATNGASEFMTNISASIVNILYNFQLMKFAKDDGVAAFGVIMYLQFVFSAIFMGYSMGIAPVIGYNYGAQRKSELKSILKKSIKLIGIMGIIMCSVATVGSDLLTKIFVGYDANLQRLTAEGMKIYSISYLLIGFNVFGSAFFTALGDGITSAGISFFRTMIYETLSVIFLPLVFGMSGIWSAIIVAEVLATCTTAIFLKKKKSQYGY